MGFVTWMSTSWNLRAAIRKYREEDLMSVVFFPFSFITDCGIVLEFDHN